jgi:hypothetical protein
MNQPSLFSRTGASRLTLAWLLLTLAATVPAAAVSLPPALQGTYVIKSAVANVNGKIEHPEFPKNTSIKLTSSGLAGISSQIQELINDLQLIGVKSRYVTKTPTAVTLNLSGTTTIGTSKVTLGAGSTIEIAVNRSVLTVSVIITGKSSGGKFNAKVTIVLVKKK